MDNMIVALLQIIEAEAKIAKEKFEHRKYWEGELLQDVYKMSNHVKELLSLLQKDKN